MDEQAVLEHVLQRKLTAIHGSNASAAKTLLAYVGLSVLQKQQKEGIGLLELQKMAADLLEADARSKVQTKFAVQRKRAGSSEPSVASKVTEVQPLMIPPPPPAREQFHANSVFA